MAGHSVVLVVLTLTVPCIFSVSLVVNYLSNTNVTDLYENDIGELSDKYYLEITPASWTFSIWGFIFTWQALWIIYAVINLFRKTDQGPLYTNPILMSAAFLGIYLINQVLIISWVFVFDREVIEAAFAILLMMVVTLVAQLVLSYRALDNYMDILVKQRRRVDIWLTRFLVHNGLSIYCTWCTIATLLNFAMVLTYRSSHDIEQKDASTVSLSILGAVILVFVTTDWFLLDRYTRYTFTPYIVLVVGLTGSVAKNYDEGARNTIITIALLAVSGVAAFVKCFLTIWRHCRRSAYSADIVTGSEKTLEPI